MALSNEQIAALLQGSNRGVYLDRLTQFLNSGENGLCANDTWQFTMKDGNPTSSNGIKSGFEAAKNSKKAPAGAENVRVVISDDKVYLINLAVAGYAAQDGQAAQPAATVAQ